MNLEHEFYLECINIRKFRHAFAQFRSGVHTLEIERGRYFNIPREQRKCKLCFTEVEDEIHFLLKCPLLADLRRKYIPSKYYTHPNVHKFTILLSSRNERVIQNIASYIYYANSFKIENNV